MPYQHILIPVSILFFVEKNAVKRSAPCEYKKSTVVGSLQKFPIKTRYKIIYGTAVPQAAGPPNIIRRDSVSWKKCDNAIPMVNDGWKNFLLFSFICVLYPIWKMATTKEPY